MIRQYIYIHLGYWKTTVDILTDISSVKMEYTSMMRELNVSLQKLLEHYRKTEDKQFIFNDWQQLY